MSIAEFYHQATKVKYEKGMEKPIDSKTWPKEWTTVYFKEYPRLPKILLPKPQNINNVLLEEVLIKRKSEREFNGEAISLQDLSSLLFYSAGIIEKKDENWNKTRRPYPSGGARFPLEIYPLILKGSSELKQGVYHYNVREHLLEKLLEEENLRKELYPQFIWQDMVLKAPVVLAISAVFERSLKKYKERGYRYILFEAGHLGQNIYLVSVGLGLKCCALGGFDDDRFCELLDINSQSEAVLYAFGLGH